MRPPLAATAVLAALTAAVAGAAPSSASAAGLTCDASALRGSILGQPAIEPVTANRGAAACQNASAGGAQAANILSGTPLSASVLGASTIVSAPGVANAKQGALATGGLGSLTVKALPTLPITLPTAIIPAGATSLTVPLSSITSAVPGLGAAVALLPGLPANVTFDLKAAVDALLPDGRLPNVDLFSLGAATAYAGAGCQNGVGSQFGVAQTTGLKVLGQDLGTDAPVSQVLSLIDTQNIDLTKLDLSLVKLPAGLPNALNALLGPVLGTIQTAVLKPLLSTLPPVSIPATVANVKLTPARQTTRADGTLVQQGPHLEIGIAGQPVVDAILGEATINGASSLNCVDAVAPPPAPDATAASLALECTSRSLVLVDVLEQNGRVKLLGAADRKLVGRTVDLRLAATGKVVATAKVLPDGSFSATAPLPAKKIRGTNKARYQARVGSEKSLDLKLSRRMVVTSLTSAGGVVTIRGRVTLPLAKPLASITLSRRVSCKRNEVVKRFKPRRDGTFTVTAAAPEGASAAVYRLGTFVRRTTTSNSTSPTFSLPRGVNLEQ